MPSGPLLRGDWRSVLGLHCCGKGYWVRTTPSRGVGEGLERRRRSPSVFWCTSGLFWRRDRETGARQSERGGFGRKRKTAQNGAVSRGVSGCGCGEAGDRYTGFPPSSGHLLRPRATSGKPQNDTWVGFCALRLKRLYWCMYHTIPYHTMSYVMCATRSPSYTKPPKPQPIRTGLPPPRWLATRAAWKGVAAPKVQPRGLRVILSTENNENKVACMRIELVL